jgi:hypothetical protein
MKSTTNKLETAEHGRAVIYTLVTLGIVTQDRYDKMTDADFKEAAEAIEFDRLAAADDYQLAK